MEEFMYLIGSACVGCGSCIHVCPEKAIGGVTAPYRIEPDKCICCGVCVGTCPVLAIHIHKKTGEKVISHYKLGNQR